MDVELTFAQQSFAFLASAVMGLGLGAVYGVLQFFRFAFSVGKAAAVALDVLFMLLWAMLIFFFSLAFLSGYIRLYVFAGSLSGLLLYRLTVGRLLCRVYRPVVRTVKKLLQKICEKLKIFAKYLLKIAAKVLYNIISGIECLRNKRKRKIHEQRTTANQKKTKQHRRRRGRRARPQGH